MGVGDELIPHGLIELNERECHVLSELLLDLADPQRVVLGVLDEAVVSLEAQLDLLENVVGLVVARATVDRLRQTWVVAADTGLESG